MSMEILLATEKGVPPGLLLPLPTEPTDKYKTENFNHTNHEIEDLVDYGGFVVALAMLGAEETGRRSLMPTAKDMTALYRAGYGISKDTLREYPERVTSIQRRLGFYPNGFRPEREELMQRFEWIAQYGLHSDADAEIEQIEDVLKWGASYDLTPNRNIVHEVLDYNLLDLRIMFNLERRGVLRQNAHLQLYRFGSRVLHEHDKPPYEKDLNAQYGHEFVGSPGTTIDYVFGAKSKFWLEFDRVPQSNGLKSQDLLNIGVRWAIKHNGHIPSTREVDRLSKAGLFFSQQPLKNHFGGVAAYRAAVAEGYERYTNLKAKFIANGVDIEAFQTACRLYEPNSEYELWLKQHQDDLIKLSRRSGSTAWLLGIMRNGFNLLDEEIFDIQFKDFIKHLRNHELDNEDSMRFIFDVVPRMNTDEAMLMAGKLGIGACYNAGK